MVGTGTRRRPRVMIVDDDVDTRELYAWAMRAAGWLVETVPDGMTAIVQAATFAPDVIVMDLHMPVLDGYEATRRLRADDATHDVPVVVCTAFSGAAAEAASRAAGGTTFVAKPFDAESMRELLERIVLDRE